MPLPRLLPTAFTRYQLDEEETVEGSIYTETQIQVLQNMLADVAEEKLALDFDPEHVLLYTQQEAYKKGQIELLQHLINNSASCAELRVNMFLSHNQDPQK